MTTLTSRPAQLGPTINDRTEMHGNEGKPALDISVTGFVLTPEEYNALAKHPAAFNGVMDTSSQPPKFAYPGLVPVVNLADTVKGCDVTLKLGLEMFVLVLAGCNLKGGSVAFEHGVPALSFKLQHEGELSGEQLLKLRAAKGKSVDIEIVLDAAKIEADKQQDLGLGAGGPSDGNAQAEAKPAKRKRSSAETNPEAIAAGAVWSTLRERWELEDGAPWVAARNSANGAHASNGAA